MRQKWLLIIFGPSLAFLGVSLFVMIFLPHPVPKRATPGQRLYLANCATCHGANGQGSWRAVIFLMRPGNLADPRVLAPLTDEYLLRLIREGGAPLGKPGMPAFGFHLSDAQIQELVVHLRTLPAQAEAGRAAPR